MPQPLSASPEKAEAQSKIATLVKMSLEDLMNVEVITAGKKMERIADIPASVVLVQREDIERMGYQSLMEILANIPGLYFTTDYQSQNLGVRGFWNTEGLKHVKILVNGIEQVEYLSGYHWPEFSPVPVEAIDRIEVVRGPMSVIYGSGAFFGAINIITNDLGRRRYLGAISSTAGSQGTGKASFRMSGEEGSFRYSTVASYAYLGGDKLPLGEIGYSPSDKVIRMHAGEGYFNFSGSFNGFSVDASHADTHHVALFMAPPEGEGTIIRSQTSHITLGHQVELSPALKLVGKLGYFSNQWTFDYDINLVPNMYAIQTNGSKGYTAELNAFWAPDSRLNISAGLGGTSVLQITYQYSAPLFGPDFALIVWNLGHNGKMESKFIFAQADYQVTDTLKLVGGARLEQMSAYSMERRQGDFQTGSYAVQSATYPRDKVDFIPRVALIYSPNARHHFKCLYGEALAEPSYFQNQDLVLDAAAPILKPETIRTYEVNYLGNLSPGFSLSASAFHNRLDELIFRTFQRSGTQLVSRHSNVGEMTTQGFELTVSAAPGDEAFKLELSGTYQKTKEQRGGLEGELVPPCSPNWVGHFKAAWDVSKNIGLALTANYVGPMEAYYDTTLAIPGRIGEGVAGHFLVGGNLRFHWPMRSGLLHLNLHGSNLLDRTVRYPATSNNAQFAQRGVIGQGRSILATLGWQF